MKTSRPNRIAELRKLRNLTQAQLAEKVDAHWVTISRLEHGHLQLNDGWLQLLSEALGVDKSQIFNWDIPQPTVYLTGDIKEGSKIKFFDMQDEFELPLDPTDSVITSWFIVVDDFGWPFIRSGDMLRFFNVNEFEASGYISRLCMIYAPDSGEGHIGFLEKGSSEQLFNLRPFVGRPIENLTVEQLRICAEIRFSMPWHGKADIAPDAK